MGRTIPSYRLALVAEELNWKPFRNALDNADRKRFDEIFSVPLLYVSACSCSVKPIRLQPVLMSILFHHYKQLLRIKQKLGVIANEPIPK